MGLVSDETRLNDLLALKEFGPKLYLAIANFFGISPATNYEKISNKTQDDAKKIYAGAMQLIEYHNKYKGQNSNDWEWKLLHALSIATDALYDTDFIPAGNNGQRISRSGIIGAMPPDLAVKIMGSGRPLYTSSFQLLFDAANEKMGPGGILDYAEKNLGQDARGLLLARCSVFSRMENLVGSKEEGLGLLDNLVATASLATSYIIGKGIEDLMKKFEFTETELAAVLDKYGKDDAQGIIAKSIWEVHNRHEKVRLPEQIAGKKTISALMVLHPGADQNPQTVEKDLIADGWSRRAGTDIYAKKVNGNDMKITLVRLKTEEEFAKYTGTAYVEPKLNSYDVVFLRGHSFQTERMMNGVKDFKGILFSGGCGEFRNAGLFWQNNPLGSFIGYSMPTESEQNNVFMRTFMETIAKSPYWDDVADAFVKNAGKYVLEAKSIVLPNSLSNVTYKNQLEITGETPPKIGI